MKKISITSLLCVWLTSTASANIDSLGFAQDLGTIIASEEFCGLSFDVSRIESLIESKVDASDTSFVGYLNTSIRAEKRRHADFTTVQKTAYCAQIKRSSKALEIAN